MHCELAGVADLKFFCEQLQVGCSVGVRVQWLEDVETSHPHLPNLVVEHPADVLEVGVRQELDTA